MNLFLIGWHISQEVQDAAVAELGSMTEVYPQLDTATLGHVASADGAAFAATMHHSPEAIGPRRYMSQAQGEVVFYDGALYDRTGEFAAHDAGELARHWEELPERLDGQYAVARIKQTPAVLEVMTDSLGYVQVYYCRRGESWLISNSVRLLVRLFQAYELDPLGVSMFLSQTWVWGDRTLHKDIQTIPAGQLWRFEAGRAEPSKQTYLPAASLISQGIRRTSEREIRQLADQMTRPLRMLSETMGPIQCDLTGGRDSRVMMALLLEGQIDSTYFTSGDTQSRDMKIAGQLARNLGLAHTTASLTNADILANWDLLCERLIRQGDGMISLWQLHNVSYPPEKIDRLIVSLTGVVYAIYYKPHEAFQRYSAEQIEQMLIDILVFRYGGLVSEEAEKLSVAAMRDTIRDYYDQGVSGLDALDAFSIYHRVGRWAGGNRNRISPAYDLFAPFCTRPYLQALFTTPHAYRYYRTLNHRLLQLTMPGLARLPYAVGRNWPLYPWLNMLEWAIQKSLKKGNRYVRRFRRSRAVSDTKETSRPFGQAAWLEAKREWMRQICLDQQDSMLWNYVDRSTFEQIMSDETEPSVRQAYRLGLYGIVTLFYYAATIKRSETNLQNTL